MNAIEAIERAFVSDAKNIAGIASVVDHEPEQLPKLPALTMLWVDVEQEDVETGPTTQDDWFWRVTLYVGVKDYREAQLLLKRLVPEVLAITRHNPSLGGTCDFAKLRGQGDPEFVKGERLGRTVTMLSKDFRLSARTNEA